MAAGVCALTAFGKFNPKTSGLLILFPFKCAIQFPAGSTIIIPSALVAHATTALGPGETRYSFTQYCSGALIRYVEYGLQSVKSLLSQPGGKERKKEIDGPPGERWKRCIRLFSRSKNLVADRKAVFEVPGTS